MTATNSKIPFRGHFTLETLNLRRKWVEQFSQSSLNEVGMWYGQQDVSTVLPVNLDVIEDQLAKSDSPVKGEMPDIFPVSALKGNIENPIGLIKMPLGVAGPLLVNGDNFQGTSVLPMATTEGALVASVTRGASLLSQAGGVNVRFIRQRMCRDPVFICCDDEAAQELYAFLAPFINVDQLQQKCVAQASRHAQLVEIEPVLLENALHLRCVFETGDASGQNMTTAASYAIMMFFLTMIQKTPAHAANLVMYAIEGQLSSDKKPTRSIRETARGCHVFAEAYLPNPLLKAMLKTDAKTLVLGTNICRVAAKHIGMLSYNINVTNVLAAVYAATGQDLGCVAEGSVAEYTLTEVEPCEEFPEGALHASLEMPGLVLGTVGGGTSLPTQRECLQMMGCTGKGSVRRLAEIIAGYCLALELSTAGAIASNQFVAAHERLGRNRPKEQHTEEHVASKL